MKKYFLCLCAAALLLGGCAQGETSAQGETPPAEETTLPSVEPEAGKFDIDAVRTHIIIKGYPFTVPQKLTGLADGLTYELVDEEFDDGLYQAEIRDENGLVLRSLARNAHRKSKKAELYNIAIEGSNSSVAGIIPNVSTADDVLKQFGEPDSILLPKESYEHKIYKYGKKEEFEGYVSVGKFMNIVFDDADVVEQIIVNYTE